MTKILITGGAGFIGSHLASSLDNEINDVYILDGWTRDYPGHTSIHRGTRGLERVSELEATYRTKAAAYRFNLIRSLPYYGSWSFQLTKPLEDVDLIINCGSLSEAILSQYFKEFTHDSIVTGVKTLKKLFSCPILHFSSSMVYGTWSGCIDENYPTNPVDWYGECKAEAETFLDTKKDIIVRPMHVYGYGDGKFPMTMNIERAYIKNSPVTVEEADCIYIKDLVNLVEQVITNWVPGTYNLSSGYIRNQNTIKNEAKNILGFDIKTVTKSGPTGKDRGTLNSSKLKNTFKWESIYSSYEDTIRDYFSIHKEKHESIS